MRATLVELTEDRATVRLTPSWLDRLLGAREVLCELDCYEGTDAEEHGWVGAGSRLWLHELPYGMLIEQALDFVPVSEVPAAHVSPW